MKSLRNREQDVLDDIAVLIDCQLAVGEQDGYELQCLCGEDWHGLAAGQCPGTPVIGEVDFTWLATRRAEFEAFVLSAVEEFRGRQASTLAIGTEAPILLIVDEFSTLIDQLMTTDPATTDVR